MSREEILAHVTRAMAELFELEPAAIRADSHLIDDLDLDSIDAIDMAARLQDLTGRRVPEEGLKSIRTVADVVDLVMNQLAEREAELDQAERGEAGRDTELEVATPSA
jgi:acyl carrier protein